VDAFSPASRVISVIAELLVFHLTLILCYIFYKIFIFSYSAFGDFVQRTPLHANPDPNSGQNDVHTSVFALGFCLLHLLCDFIVFTDLYPDCVSRRLNFICTYLYCL